MSHARNLIRTMCVAILLAGLALSLNVTPASASQPCGKVYGNSPSDDMPVDPGKTAQKCPEKPKPTKKPEPKPKPPVVKPKPPVVKPKPKPRPTHSSSTTVVHVPDPAPKPHKAKPKPAHKPKAKPQRAKKNTPTQTPITACGYAPATKVVTERTTLGPAFWAAMGGALLLAAIAGSWLLQAFGHKLPARVRWFFTGTREHLKSTPQV